MPKSAFALRAKANNLHLKVRKIKEKIGKAKLANIKTLCNEFEAVGFEVKCKPVTDAYRHAFSSKHITLWLGNAAKYKIGQYIHNRLQWTRVEWSHDPPRVTDEQAEVLHWSGDWSDRFNEYWRGDTDMKNVGDVIAAMKRRV